MTMNFEEYKLDIANKFYKDILECKKESEIIGVVEFLKLNLAIARAMVKN